MNETSLFSIKEFSEFTGVSQSTLRYYDEINLLPPAARGENYYRYYAPFQIILLNFINVLIDLGIPLTTIKEMSKDRTPKSIIDLLSRQETKLDASVHELWTAYTIIHTFRNNIQEGLLADVNEISVQELDEAKLVLGPDTDFEDKDTFYEEFIKFCNSANDYRINLRYPIGGYHQDINTFLAAPNKPDKFYSQDPIGNTLRKRGAYLVAYRRGYYGVFGDMPQRIETFAKEHGLVFNGPVYVGYLLDEISIVDPSQYVSKFMAGVTHIEV
ncbi:MAG: MerR family DNA-binding transcriptional regulator [Clostridiales bacterium]|nr:MerR family DNA-binding transcriptional regulator [Clostridiales bacterium]